jgi:hypothetical protein
MVFSWRRLLVIAQLPQLAPTGACPISAVTVMSSEVADTRLEVKGNSFLRQNFAIHLLLFGVPDFGATIHENYRY